MALQRPILNQKLKSGSPAYGIFSGMPAPEVLELIGLAGWDFAIIDGEHSPVTAATLPALVRAASCAGLPPIVRVATNEPSAIQHALDCGAAGVQIPQISSLAQAKSAIDAARFYPAGKRGFNPFVRAAAFSTIPTADFVESSNRDVTLILQLESAEGVAACEAILDLPGIDVVFVGPYDLSQSLGIPGQVDDPRVFEAGSLIVKAAEIRGIVAGVYCHTLQQVTRWRAAGARYIVHSVDTIQLLATLRATRQSLDALAKTAQSQPG